MELVLLIARLGIWVYTEGMGDRSIYFLSGALTKPELFPHPIDVSVLIYLPPPLYDTDNEACYKDDYQEAPSNDG